MISIVVVRVGDGLRGDGVSRRDADSDGLADGDNDDVHERTSREVDSTALVDRDRVLEALCVTVRDAFVVPVGE